MENNQNKNNNIAPNTDPLKKDVTSTYGDVIHPEDRITIKPLRTYADDIKNLVANDNVSMIKIAIAEEKKQEQQAKDDENLDPRSKKNINIFLLSGILIVLGCVAFAGVWYFMSEKNVQVTNTAPQKHIAIIPFDEENPIALNTFERKEVVSGLTSSQSKKYEDDTTLIYLPIIDQSGTTTSLVGVERFLSVLQTRAPEALVRALNPQFMFGLDRKGNQYKPFLLLKTDSLSQVYPGMLEWEPAMADDIGDIFFSKNDLIVPVQVSTSTGTGTSTSSSTPPVEIRNILADSLIFKDELVNNKDIRALRTKDGRLLMYYSFIGDKLVLIAKDFGTIAEISKRLATSQFTQ
ncbi:MAG: hypothetical protein WCO12_03180 [bacterium]